MHHVTMDTLSNMEKYIDFFRLLCLQDISFFNENQYTVACAIVSTARMYSRIQPVWAPELAQLSGLQHHHFLNVEQKIIEAFEAAVPSESQLGSSQMTETNPLQTSSHASRAQNRNERSDIFEKEEMERLLQKNKVSSAQKTKESSQGHHSGSGYKPSSESPL